MRYVRTVQLARGVSDEDIGYPRLLAHRCEACDPAVLAHLVQLDRVLPRGVEWQAEVDIALARLDRGIEDLDVEPPGNGAHNDVRLLQERLNLIHISGVDLLAG